MKNLKEVMAFIVEATDLNVDLDRVLLGQVSEENRANGTAGSIEQIAGGYYVIRIADDLVWGSEELYEVLVHELRHLEQYQTMSLFKAFGEAVWKGKAYDADMPYIERPWELDAHAFARKYVIRIKAAKTYNKMVEWNTKIQSWLISYLPVLGC